jgi:hypothetical protein
MLNVIVGSDGAPCRRAWCGGAAVGTRDPLNLKSGSALGQRQSVLCAVAASGIVNLYKQYIDLLIYIEAST